MNAFTIGPLILSVDRFAGIIAICVFMLVGEVLARKVSQRFTNWSWWVVVAFIFGGRAGHVVAHFSSFKTELWRVVAIWQGGFSVTAGVIVAFITSFFLMRRYMTLLGWSVIPFATSAFAALVVIQLGASTPPTPLPTNSFLSYSGGTVIPASLAGKPLVVNLWATWCPPCRREMPMMAEVAASTDQASFVFVNQGESRPAVESYLQRESITLNNLLLDTLGEFSRHYKTPGLPATLFINSDGKLKSVYMGEISRENLISGIEALN